MASWEHRDSQLNHLDAERGLAKLPLPGEQSLLKFTISTLCRLQMRWQGWHLGHSWWRGHPQSPFPFVRPCSLSTPSAPAFCWKSLEGLWTDLCSSLPSLLTFCVVWRKPLGSCKSQFPQEQDVEQQLFCRNGIVYIKDAANFQPLLQSMSGLLIFCPKAAARSGPVWCTVFRACHEFDVMNALPPVGTIKK